MTASRDVGAILGGKYRLVRLLGRGGASSVFEAERLEDGERFALKRLDLPARAPGSSADAATLARFAREVRAATALTSPRIVQVVDVGSDDDAPFLVMALLHGEDLGERLRRETRIAPRDAIAIGLQILEGLEHAHAAGVVHRDLKPDNVFLGDDGSGVRILDFGVSKVDRLGGTVPLAVTLRGVAVGTPLYMSPEQAFADPTVDARSDLYSVGAILFECVSGRPPHTGESNDVILESIRAGAPPGVRSVAAGVPPELAAVIDRALAFDRTDRFPSARLMRSALQSAARALRPPARRVWLLGALAVLAGALTTLAVAWAIGRPVR